MSDWLTAKAAPAWQPWELPSFDPVVAAPEEQVNLPTAEQIEQIQRQAHDEAVEAGHAEGYQAGYAAGAAAAQQQAEQLAVLMSRLDQALQQVDAQVAQSLLDLSLELARQMLHQALAVKPELLLEVVRAAIAELPHFNQGAHLVLNPADAGLVRQQLGDQLAHAGWKIFEDTQLERGGCRVQTANSQIDATLPTRWQRVVATLGQDSSWLA